MKDHAFMNNNNMFICPYTCAADHAHLFVEILIGGRRGEFRHKQISHRRKAGDQFRREQAKRGEAGMFGGEGGHELALS